MTGSWVVRALDWLDSTPARAPVTAALVAIGLVLIALERARASK